jgi:opacity protein-like surface antigen
VSAVPHATDPVPSRTRAFEPEFAPSRPREIPDELLDGPFARRQKRAALAGVAGAVASVAAMQAPGVDVLALYVVPFEYLGWVAAFFALVAVASYAHVAFRGGPFRYVRQGVPLNVRILDVALAPASVVNGVPHGYTFHALISFVHPDTGEVVQRVTQSDVFGADGRDRYEPPFRVGDDATAVYFEGRLDETLQLYAFLDVSPALDFRRRGDETPTARIVLGASAIVALLIVAFANVMRSAGTIRSTSTTDRRACRYCSAR